MVMLMCFSFSMPIVVVGRVNTMVMCVVVGLAVVCMLMVMIVAVLMRVCMGFTTFFMVLMLVPLIFIVTVGMFPFMLMIMFMVSSVSMVMCRWMGMRERVIMSVVMCRFTTNVLMRMVSLSSIQMVLFFLLCGLKDKVKTTVLQINKCTSML